MLQPLKKLLKLTAPSITLQDTNIREAISQGERLALTLRFSATGNKLLCMCICCTPINMHFCTTDENYSSLWGAICVKTKTLIGI